MNSSTTSTTSSSDEGYNKNQTVTWYLVNDNTGEVITGREDITDLIEVRKHTDAPTRMTDTLPDDYE